MPPALVAMTAGIILGHNRMKKGAVARRGPSGLAVGAIRCKFQMRFSTVGHYLISGRIPPMKIGYIKDICGHCKR